MDDADVEARYTEAQAAFDAEDYERAAELFQALVEEMPIDHRARDEMLWNTGMSYLRAGDRDTAWEWARLSGYDEERFLRAVREYLERELREVEEDIEEEQAEPDDDDPSFRISVYKEYYESAEAHYAAGDYETAKQLFERAWAGALEDQDNSEVVQDIARCHVQLGEIAEGRQLMVDAGLGADAYDDLRKELVAEWFYPAQEAFDARDYRQAFNGYQLVASAYEEGEKPYEAMYFNMAVCLYRLGESDEARAALAQGGWGEDEWAQIQREAAAGEAPEGAAE